MKKINVIISICIALSFSTCFLSCKAKGYSGFSRATANSGGKLKTQQAAFDVGHVSLAIQFFPETRSIRGTATLELKAVKPLNAILLDLDSRFNISELIVFAGSQQYRPEFTRPEGQIQFSLEQQLKEGAKAKVQIEYEGQPNEAVRPPWKGGFTWSKTSAGKPWIAVSCQSEGADVWWPCKDHPSDEPESMNISLTVPKGLVAVSNGTLKSTVPNNDGTVTWNWSTSYPINNYLVTFCVGPLVKVEHLYKSKVAEPYTVAWWVLEENRKKCEEHMGRTLQTLEFFEEVLGPFPWREDKVGFVETPFWGMEHQTLIAYGNKFKVNDWGYDYILNHELSHEWWGNLVTANSWHDAWVHEGFGTYMQNLYVERKQGAELYRNSMSAYLSRIRNKFPVRPPQPADIKTGFRGDIYFKGAWILHTLRYLIGDEVFFRSIRSFVDRARAPGKSGTIAGKFASTEEFISIINKAAGRNLNWFFKSYLEQAALPELLIDVRGNIVDFSWSAKPGQVFSVPIPIRIGGKTIIVPMNGGQGQLILSEGTVFEVDPEMWILRNKLVLKAKKSRRK